MASRKERPEPRWRKRLAAASTPAEQFAAARDAFTAALATLGRSRRDVLLTARCRAEADAELRSAAEWLTGRANAIYDREREIRNNLRRGDAA